MKLLVLGLLLGQSPADAVREYLNKGESQQVRPDPGRLQALDLACKVESTVDSLPVEAMQKACKYPIAAIKVSVVSMEGARVLVEDMKYTQRLEGLPLAGNPVPSDIAKMAIQRFFIYTTIDAFDAYRLTVFDGDDKRLCTVNYFPQQFGTHLPGGLTIDCDPVVGKPTEHKHDEGPKPAPKDFSPGPAGDETDI